MGLSESLVIYAVTGAAVAVAIYLVDGRHSILRTGFLLTTAVFFWPLYLPLLLSSRAAKEVAPVREVNPKDDEMAVAIAQVERELDAALSSLDGWAENVLAGEASRIAELCHALTTQATRIREMDELLRRTNPETSPAGTSLLPHSLPSSDAVARWHKSRQGRAQNLTRLAEVRRQSHEDLMATLAWIRELVSMIHLAKFTGAPPASRAEELVAQIAAAVEGVSAVAWNESDCKLEPSHL